MAEKYLTLKNGQQAIVDEEDFNDLCQYKWSLNNSGYVSGGSGEFLHRQVMSKITDITDKHIDHKNKNKLDCRKSNLRVCDGSQNNANTLKRENNTSGYKGVTLSKIRDKYPWCAKIAYHNKHKNIGFFNTAREAAIAYDIYAKFLYAEFAILNISDVTSKEIDSITQVLTKECKRHKSRKTKYFGIEYEPRTNKWAVRVNRKCLGTFESEVEAAKVADQELLRIGDVFHVNFENPTTLEDVIRKNFDL